MNKGTRLCRTFSLTLLLSCLIHPFQEPPKKNDGAGVKCYRFGRTGSSGRQWFGEPVVMAGWLVGHAPEPVPRSPLARPALPRPVSALQLACLKRCAPDLPASPESETWFLDRALYWHFLTKSSTACYQLMMTHLGLPQWQYISTGYGLSPQAMKLFHVYKTITVNTEQLWEAADVSFIKKLDPNKVFRSKTKASLVKRRPPSQVAASQKSQTAGGSPRTPSQGGSLSRRRETQP